MKLNEALERSLALYREVADHAGLERSSHRTGKWKPQDKHLVAAAASSSGRDGQQAGVPLGLYREGGGPF